MRKKRKTVNEIIKILIDKELEPYGVTIEKVLETPKINDIPWYDYYTFKSDEEYYNWRDFCIETIRKEIPNCTKTMAEKEFSWVVLSWGLKILK